MLKGFGKNYFKLVAIQAYSSAIELYAKEIRIKRYHLNYLIYNNLELNEPQLDEELLKNILEKKLIAQYCRVYFKNHLFYLLSSTTYNIKYFITKSKRNCQ